MQPLVVGFVETETAQHAALEAPALAVRLGAPLHVVTAIDDPGTETFAAFGERVVVDDVDRAERAIHHFMVGLPEAPSYTAAVVDAKPAEALLAEAERLDAQLIVVGNVRMQGPGRILGSVGNTVVQRAPCNVLIVKTT